MYLPSAAATMLLAVTIPTFFNAWDIDDEKLLIASWIFVIWPRNYDSFFEISP